MIDKWDIRDIKLYPHQIKIVYPNEFQAKAIVGGVGSGKSLPCMGGLIAHLLKYKTQGMALMRTATETEGKLKSDIIEKFGEVFVSTSGKKMVLKNGSFLHLQHGWDDERGVRHLDGFNISVSWICQADAVPIDTWGKVKDRSRNMSANGEIRYYLDGNPAGKDWLYDEFIRGGTKKSLKATINGKEYFWDEFDGETEYLDDDGSTKSYKHIAIVLPTQRFPWLPPGYIESICKGRSQRYIDRYVLGKFDSYSGLVYDCWDDTNNVIDPFPIKSRGISDIWVRVVGIDCGFRNPTAVIWAMYNKLDDYYVVYREMVVKGLTARQAAEAALKASGDETPDFVFIDPSSKNVDQINGSSVFNEWSQGTMKDGLSWPLITADNTVEQGVESVYWYIAQRKFLVFKTCQRLITGLTHYRYPDNAEDKDPKYNLKEAPLKKDDHECDAVRYMVHNSGIYKTIFARGLYDED